MHNAKDVDELKIVRGGDRKSSGSNDPLDNSKIAESTSVSSRTIMNGAKCARNSLIFCAVLILVRFEE